VRLYGFCNAPQIRLQILARESLPIILGGWVHASLSNHDLKNDFPLALESGKFRDVFVPNNIQEEIPSVREEIS